MFDMAVGLPEPIGKEINATNERSIDSEIILKLYWNYLYERMRTLFSIIFIMLKNSVRRNVNITWIEKM